MLNEHQINLINSDIDGEISGDEAAELSALLLESAEARKLHEDLSSLDRMLGAVPEAELPEQLEGLIFRQVDLPRRHRWFTPFAGWMQGNPIPYGAAAAGVLATVLVYELGSGPAGTGDYSDLVGTLARGNGIEGAIQLSYLDIDLPVVQGRVKLTGSGDLKLLRFDVDSEDAVDFEVGLEGSGLKFGGFAQAEGGEDENLGFANGKFRVSNTGAQQFTVILRDIPEQQGPAGGIVVSVSQAGEPLYQGVLSL